MRIKFFRVFSFVAAHACTVDEVEKTIGHDFFYNLSDDVDNSIEATFKVKDWK